MTRHQTLRGWRAELAPGRVFELKRKTYWGNPVCVLITRIPDRWSSHPMCVQVNDRGCVEEASYDRARFYVGALCLDDFKSPLVVRRRPDLERFDARDLALIDYGIPLDFRGRWLKHRYGGMSLPSIPGVQWTIFWTHANDWPTWDVRPEIDSLLAGDWHFTTSSHDPRAHLQRVTAWATAKEDPEVLRAIRKTLGRLVPLEVCAVAVKARDIGDHWEIRPDGNGGPAISTRWREAISKKTGDRSWTG
jgi:hypothetical protein